ncbi:hypothetical protein L3X38_010460 [Prunus dulcis]|uniref:Uncharacterized protein n=1 Tax=Prunus dulcis TaxID=3755 RepID=A0AAD4WFN0_PRUDU|nr:hypothetical protein L3X38_010460 [Prunus dulcis]
MMKYEMTDFGLLHHFLGMGVVRTRSSIFNHQKKNASSLLKKFGLNECKTVTTPLAAIEKLTKDDGMIGVDQLKTVRAHLDMHSFLAVVFSLGLQSRKTMLYCRQQRQSTLEATAQAIWLRFVLEDFG